MKNTDIRSEEKDKKKNFLVVSFIGCSLLIWFLQSVLGGFFYATVAFFTKEGWDKWKAKRRDYL